METEERLETIMDHYRSSEKQRWMLARKLISELLEGLEKYNIQMLYIIDEKRKLFKNNPTEEILRNLNMKISSQRMLSETIRSLQGIRSEMSNPIKLNRLI
jgi:hypothetical protein